MEKEEVWLEIHDTRKYGGSCILYSRLLGCSVYIMVYTVYMRLYLILVLALLLFLVNGRSVTSLRSDQSEALKNARQTPLHVAVINIVSGATPTPCKRS